MPAGNQTRNGKAFEYAMVKCLAQNASLDAVIVNNAPMETARQCYESLPARAQTDLDEAAVVAVQALCYLEPMMSDTSCGQMELEIQADAMGISGDVRDVVLRRGGWEIGISCKHNHQAVKHPRLSGTIDFGEKWLGVPCTAQYWSEIRPVFAEMQALRDSSGGQAVWPADTHERFYEPILKSFINELKRLYEFDPKTVAQSLIHYMLGREDFYKIMTEDRGRYNTLEAINTNETLGRASSQGAARVSLRKTEMPSLIHYIGMAEGSDTTALIVLDKGWQISMRLHSAKKTVEPSLKFDVQLVSVPRTLHSQVLYWMPVV